MRAVVEVEEIQGRTCLVVTELPYQVNPDNLALKIADLVNDGKVAGIADIRDDSSSRTGQRLVVVLKRDAVAKVVLNNLYKHTQLQDNFGANMLALVDGVPRTLRLDEFVRHWITHQLEVIERRTRYRLRKAEERAHILRRAAQGARRARRGHRADPRERVRGRRRTRRPDGSCSRSTSCRPRAILDMQLRQLAALERQEHQDEHDELMARIADYNDILANEPRQRADRRRGAGRDRREVRRRAADPASSPAEGEMSMEDLIAEEDVVVTITRGGYAKRTKVDLYRSQRRGGKGVRGAALKTGRRRRPLLRDHDARLDPVLHQQGPGLPGQGLRAARTPARDARGQHVANLLAFQPDEQIAQVLDLRDYDRGALPRARDAGWAWSRRPGSASTTRRAPAALIAINLRDDDELIAARLVQRDRRPDPGVPQGAVGALPRRPTSSCGRWARATSGVIGMRFRDERRAARDGRRARGRRPGHVHRRRLLEAHRAVRVDAQGARWPRHDRDEARPSTAARSSARMVVDEGDQVLAITESGGVIRTQGVARTRCSAGPATPWACG